MLAGQDLRRGKQCGLHAVFCSETGSRGGDHRLAAANIALHKAAHGAACAHVGADVVHGTLLCARQAEGEGGKKRRKLRLPCRAGVSRAAAAHDGKRGGKEKEFLKNEPALRPAQRGGRRGAVDLAAGLRRAAQTVAAQQLRRQRLGQEPGAAGDSLRLRAQHHGVRQPGRQGIDGQDAPCDAGRAVVRLEQRVRHAIGGVIAGQHAVKAVALADAQRSGGVRGVEKRQIQAARVVGHGEFRDLEHAAAGLGDAVRARRGNNGRFKAGGRAGLERGDGNKARPVLIGARIQPQQLADSADVQPGEQRSALRADAGQGRERGVEGNGLFHNRTS